MNICKVIVAGAFLAPALVFGLNPDEHDRKTQDQQQQQQREQQQREQLRGQQRGQEGQLRGQEGQQRAQERGQQREQHGGRQSGQAGASGMDGDQHGFITRSTGNTISLENLIGSSARTTDNEEVGNVQDILIDSDGQAVAVIISVGGFLGIGQKDVAVSWREVTVAPENDSGGMTGRSGSARPGAAGQARMGSEGQARTGADDQARTGTTGEARTGTTGQAHGRSHDPSDYVLFVNVTEDTLKDAPEFQRDWD